MSRRAPIPYDFLPPVATLDVASDEIVHLGRLPHKHVSNAIGIEGGNQSPQLRWSGAPAETESYAVTCFDPDAPTGSGFWHWVLYNLPKELMELPSGAGSGKWALPEGAVQARNDDNIFGYSGAAPPPGPEHRYIFAVHALKIPRLTLPTEATAALVGFNLTMNTIARGLIVTTFGR